MKKLLFIMLAATLAFTGCKKKSDEFEFEFEYEDDYISEDSDNEWTDGAMSEANRSIESLVKSRYSKEGSYDISYEETDSYTAEFSYNIPMINDDSDAANTINSAIFEDAKKSIDLVESILDGSAEEIYEPEYINIDYNAYLNGNVVSIVVKSESAYSDWVEYGVYNYNIDTHEEAKNAELFELAQVSKDDFVKMAKKTFGALALPDLDDFFEAEAFEETEATNDAENPDEWKYTILADYISDYVQTVSDKNINADIPAYLDEDGNICSVNLVYVPAGAGQYYHDAKLEDKNNDAMIKKYCEYVEKYHFDGFEKESLKLYETEGLQGSIVRKISLSNMSSEDVYIGFDDSDASIFTMQFYGSDYSNVYTGTIAFSGIDENGILYEYELNEKNGEALGSDEEPVHSGSFYLNAYSYYEQDIDDYVSGAIYKFKDGDDMLASDGYNVDLHKAFG